MAEQEFLYGLYCAPGGGEEENGKLTSSSTSKVLVFPSTFVSVCLASSELMSSGSSIPVICLCISEWSFETFGVLDSVSQMIKS